MSVFDSFLAEVEAEFPYLYAEGGFEPLADALYELRNETSEAGIQRSDLAVSLCRTPDKDGLIGKLFWLEHMLGLELEVFKPPR